MIAAAQSAFLSSCIAIAKAGARRGDTSADLAHERISTYALDDNLYGQTEYGERA